MSKEFAVGIDLGTTYSAMAWVDETGQSVLLHNAEGDLLTPSVVMFEDDQVLVGKEAKRLGVYAADRLAECVKRDMGSPAFSRPIAGRQLPPEAIQAYILRKIRNDITKTIGDDFKVVITVPAFFDEPRRKATVDAAHIAGLHVLDIVNEPTSAALAFGEGLGFLRATGAAAVRMNVLVYDLGGGTFDVTLIEMKQGNLRTIATDGDVRLGGRDWDMALVDYCSQQFVQQFGSDPREDHVCLLRMLGAVEEAKHTLSARNNATIKVSYDGHDADLRITREVFEEETAHLLERTAYVTRQLLTASGLEWADLSRILLVGGSTRMPMVASMLQERTGLTPDHSVNPDEAVARGAALYADYLLAQRSETRKTKFQVTNVNSHSLGIEGVDPKTGRKCNNVLIRRNTPLPATKTERFVTKKAGQRSVVLKVLEGESQVPDECTPIGKAVIRDLPPNLPAGSTIRVTYEYGTNGRLNVTAGVKGTGKEIHLELERDGALSNALVAQWGRVIAAGGGLQSFDALLQGQPAPPPPMAVQSGPTIPASLSGRTLPTPSHAPGMTSTPSSQPAGLMPPTTTKASPTMPDTGGTVQAPPVQSPAPSPPVPNSSQPTASPTPPVPNPNWPAGGAAGAAMPASVASSSPAQPAAVAHPAASQPAPGGPPAHRPAPVTAPASTDSDRSFFATPLGWIVVLLVLSGVLGLGLLLGQMF